MVSGSLDVDAWFFLAADGFALCDQLIVVARKEETTTLAS